MVSDTKFDMRHRILQKIGTFVTNWPKAVLGAALVLTGVSLFVSQTRLALHTDQDDLVSEKLAYHKRYKDFLRGFGDLEYLYIVVEVENNLPRAKEFTEKLAGRLSVIEDLKEVTHKVENPALEKSFLLYLSEPELEGLKKFLSTGPTSIQNIARWKSLNDVLKTLNGVMESPDLESRQEEMKTGFGFLSELIDGLVRTIETGRTASPQLAGAFLGGSEAIDIDGFLLTPNGKLLFTLIMPKKSYDTLSVIEEPLKKIRSALQETKKEFPGIKAGLTGRPVLQADETSTTNSDMTRATILAVIAVTILFAAYFKRLTRPLMAIVSLLFGISWTLGLATIVIGYLNLLSSVFAVVLIGAGIEFGLQIVARYREELHDHKNPRRAAIRCITATGRGNITAAATTAAAFFTAGLTGFKALGELGFIAGSGILLCLISLVIVLPAMMYLKDRGKHESRLVTHLLFDLKGMEPLYNRHKALLVLLLLLTLIGLPGLARLRFDHNLLNLQSEGLESVDYEKLIIEKSDESTWYAVALTKSFEESQAIAKEMREKETVGRVETLGKVVPENQKTKIKLVAELKKAFEGVAYAETEKVVNKEGLLQALQTMQSNLERIEEMAFSSGHAEAAEELENLNGKTKAMVQTLPRISPEKLTRLSEFQSIFMTELKKGLKILEGGLEPEEITKEDLPASLVGRYIGKNGVFATYVYPKYDIWDPGLMEAFVTDIRSIDPEITGTPIEVFESSRLMQKSFKKAALYAFLAIFAIVLFDFRNLKYALLTLMPLMAGVLWLLEGMGWLGIPFNLANFFAIPVLLGVGVDNGVQIVHRYLQDGDTKVMSKSTGAAVLLTSLTTAISFGMLLTSSHRGIQSLGLIMTIGTFTTLIGAGLLLPLLLRLTTARQQPLKKGP